MKRCPPGYSVTSHIVRVIKRLQMPLQVRVVDRRVVSESSHSLLVGLLSLPARLRMLGSSAVVVGAKSLAQEVNELGDEMFPGTDEDVLGDPVPVNTIY